MMAYMLFYVPEFKKNRLFLKIHDKVKWYLQQVVGLAQSKWFNGSSFKLHIPMF